jgi:hypothetical protein
MPRAVTPEQRKSVKVPNQNWPFFYSPLPYVKNSNDFYKGELLSLRGTKCWAYILVSVCNSHCCINLGLVLKGTHSMDNENLMVTLTIRN